MEIKELRLGKLTIPSNVIMAPLAGYTCYPFRMLCTKLGAGLCYTEMLSCNGLKYKDKATEKLLFTTSHEKIKAVQLLGESPRVMEKMAKSDYLDKFDIIDINIGCPVPNVFKSGAGSALLGEFKKAASIIRGCKKSGKVLTVKFRVGLRENILIAGEFAKMCEDSGADMISIHGRTRNMMYEGTPYFDQIEQAKSVVKIPVIANGGIFSVKEAEEMMNKTGVDGLMIGRYALENPFIFSELTNKEIRKDKYMIINEQIDLTLRYFDETYTMAYIKKLISFCMKKRQGTKKYKMDLFKCGNISELKYIVEKIFLESEKA